MQPDYVSELEATLVVEKKGTRFLCGKQNAIFVGRTPSEVASAVNDAMHVAVRYFTGNLARASVRISELLVREASLRVIVTMLYGCSVRREALRIDEPELENMFARGDLVWFCEETFGKDYRDFASAMMGLDADEFARWEEGWERYVNK